jgi:predicted ATPase
VLATSRPVDTANHGHEVHAVAQELQRQGRSTELALEYLAEAGVVTYLSRRFHGEPAATALASLLHQRTTGNPLFLVTVVEDLIQRGLLREDASGAVFADPADGISQTIPSSLQHLIEQQFERLSPDDQAVLSLACVVGVEFAAATIAVVMRRQLEDTELQWAALARRNEPDACVWNMD